MAQRIPVGYAQVTFKTPGPSAYSADAVFTLGVQAVVLAEMDTGNEIAAGIALRCNAAATTLLGSELATGWGFHGVSVNYRHSDDLLYQYMSVTNVSGSGTSQAMIPSVALVVKKQTGVGGRSNRGRMYLGGVLREDQVDNQGLVNSGTLVALQNSLNSFHTDLNAPATSSQARCIPNLLHAESPIQPGLPPVPVLAFLAQQLVGTQRRRLR